MSSPTHNIYPPPAPFLAASGHALLSLFCTGAKSIFFIFNYFRTLGVFSRDCAHRAFSGPSFCTLQSSHHQIEAYPLLFQRFTHSFEKTPG